jgi:elongation factor Ts
MANISIDDVKRLRELTGVGITDAKQALVEAKGDFDKALEQMRKKGLTKAEKRGEQRSQRQAGRKYCRPSIFAPGLGRNQLEPKPPHF